MAFLSDLIPIPESTAARIDGEADLDTLKRWVKSAARSAYLEEFVRKM